MGYEPDVFSAMYRIRDNILESLDEGIIAIDNEGGVQFVNSAAGSMLNQIENGLATKIVGEKIDNVKLGSETLLVDRMPIKENEVCVGEIAILHDRAEYTKLMEDLTGTRYLVDSMRANNHDFTNKLHVILGLIQMEMYDKAVSYIENITIVQRSTISKIMNAVQEPAVAALLIGKTARASELNIKFVLHEGCFYSNADMQLPSELLVTIIGNLIENAFEAMNDNMDCNVQKELIFGIYSRPGAVLITTDDTGVGISEENLQRIFDNGFSTKGEGRGTGLYQVKEMVERYGGMISVESQEGVGSSFTVSFTK
jgi:sensor histidine kinase regulating citrate/malate metabolism